MTVVMQLELSLKYFKPVFKDLKVFTGLWLHNITTSTGGRVGGLSETRNKAITASIEIGYKNICCFYLPVRFRDVECAWLTLAERKKAGHQGERLRDFIQQHT